MITDEMYQSRVRQPTWDDAVAILGCSAEDCFKHTPFALLSTVWYSYSQQCQDGLVHINTTVLDSDVKCVAGGACLGRTVSIPTDYLVEDDLPRDLCDIDPVILTDEGFKMLSWDDGAVYPVVDKVKALTARVEGWLEEAMARSVERGQHARLKAEYESRRTYQTGPMH